LKSALLAALMLAVSSAGSSQETFWQEMTTAERIAKSAWWPTKLANTTDKFTGNAACAECHADIVKSQEQSEMARTLQPAKDGVVASYFGKSITVDGFTYRFAKTPEAVSFNLTTAKPPVSETLLWAFGSGAISQVYLTPQHDGSFNESHFSYFKKINGFDVTPAQPKIRDLLRAGNDDQEMKNAVGRRVSAEESTRCFSCHAANVPAKGDLTAVLPGVNCEACHGPGGNHSAAMRAGLAQGSGLIFNPANLSAVDRVDFCGSCHGTSLDILTEGSAGLASVRFPAYRLQNSKCWSNDNRIQCTACHDPHRSIEKDASAYNSRCLACHTAKAMNGARAEKTCPKATKDCVSCHMPKYDFPNVHTAFTDHQIRVVKPGEEVPM
jgi:mono/diheme cytochrome c family protein